MRGFYKSQRSYSKGNAGWVSCDGHSFYARSSWEANYGRYLQFQLKHGLIKGWEHEPDTFWFEGIKRGGMSYLPDFKITNNDGTVEYHEVKGWMTPKAATKIKRMAKYFPGVVLKLFDAKWYRKNQRKLSGIVPGWNDPYLKSNPNKENPQ